MPKSLQWFLLVFVACLMSGSAAAVAVNAISVFEVVADELPLDDVLEGDYDRQFLPVPDGQIRARGGIGRGYWVRIAYSVPADDVQPSPRYVLELDRIDLDEVTLYTRVQSGSWRASSDGFFEPTGSGGAILHKYSFALPDQAGTEHVVYLWLTGLNRMALTPDLTRERDAFVNDRNVSSLLSAIYASIVVLMLSAFALFLALRERTYLHFVALSFVLLLLLLAVNGHLYRIPGLQWFAWWRGNGVHLLALVCASVAVGFSQHFLELDRVDAKAGRLAWRVRQGLLAIAALCLLDLRSIVPAMQTMTAAVTVLTAVFLVVVSLRAMRRGQGMARAYSLVWMLLTAAIVARAALALGWLPQTALTQFGFQILIALMLFLMSIGLADRVMEFRRQRDRARQLKEQTDATLQVEQIRREFIEGLREHLRDTTPGGDLEWLAFKRVLTSLRSLIPQRTSAVVAFGYHDLDLLMIEPIEAKERYARLMAVRSGTLKGLCRSRNPVQAQLDDRAEGAETHEPEDEHRGGLFAVIPIQMPLPGWGALLIERDAEDSFQPTELKLAAELLRQATVATDEAASQAELKRKAELDALTGACNRRSGDAMLKQALDRAMLAREPLSVLYIDLDHFKQINDRHGHAIGDDCLRLAADAIRHELDDRDVLVRHGGEEFLVVLPGSNADQARKLAEAIRTSVSRLRLGSDANIVRFTVSIGVASRLGGEQNPQGLVERADRALYSAKRNGRNQVQAAQSYGFGVQDDSEPPPDVKL